MAETYYIVRWDEGQGVSIRRMTEEQLIKFLAELSTDRHFTLKYLEVVKQ